MHIVDCDINFSLVTMAIIDDTNLFLLDFEFDNRLPHVYGKYILIIINLRLHMNEAGREIINRNKRP